MKNYLKKMRGGAALPQRPAIGYVFWSWCGGVFAIGLVAYIAVATGQPILMAPLGASAVLAFGVPDSPLAQPRNIIGGHVLTATIGVLFLNLFGAEWWSMGLAVATAIAAMQITRTVHPQAGANPLVVMLVGASWGYVLTPVLAGSLILTSCAVIFNNLSANRRYPLYWS